MARVYLMINAHNNLVQWKKWKMLGGSQGRCNPGLSQQREKMTCHHHLHFCQASGWTSRLAVGHIRILQASHWFKCSLRPLWASPASKYKLLICCKNIYRLIEFWWITTKNLSWYFQPKISLECPERTTPYSSCPQRHNLIAMNR